MKQTIFVLLDACQHQAGTKNLGYLEHLIDYEKGAKYQVKGELPSLSRPMYETCLTGLPVYLHGISNNNICRKSSVENVFSLCCKQGKSTAAAAYYWNSELYNHAPFDKGRDRIQFHSEGNIQNGIFYWEDSYPDTHLFADGEYLRTQFKPNFLMIHSMAIDNQGHLHGSDSKEYEEAIETADMILSTLLPIWLEDGADVVVTADHGMNTLGHHGGTDWEQRNVPLYIFSSLVEKGRFEEKTISQLNIAPLLCSLLGIEKAKGMIEIEEIGGL